MAFSTGGNRGPMADINVTPLVDVMLVLLIIFIVTAPIMTYPIA
ncbi:biopolymer transporter ExbD, partial [Xanthomonas melonis]